MRARTKRFALAVATLGLLCGSAGQAKAGLLVNGDFETGNLTGWSPYATTRGTTGDSLPDVVSFNTTGAGASNAAHFEAGEESGSFYDGGGITQTFHFGGGPLSLSADVAVYAPNANDSGGRFELLLDGTVEATVEFTSMTAGQTLRGTLSKVVTVGAGDHLLSIEITRPLKSHSGSTPYQYVDNVNAVLYSPTPEPSTFVSAGLGGLIMLGWVGRRRLGRAGR